MSDTGGFPRAPAPGVTVVDAIVNGDTANPPSGNAVFDALALKAATASLGTAAAKNTGTSGNAVPLLDGANTWSAQQTFAAGTITTSQPLTVTQTWNAAGVTFTGLKVGITSTASAAASMVQDWQVGGASIAYIRKDGLLAGQDLWVGNTTSTTAAISLRGNPGVSGWYGLGYDNGNDATFLFGYAGRKFTLGTRQFAGTYNPRFTFDDGAGQTWTHSEGINYVFGTSTGTKLGTAASQKIGFWNATPIVQPASANQAAVTLTAGATYTSNEQDTINALKTLVNQLRADLVAAGIIKGAA